MNIDNISNEQKFLEQFKKRIVKETLKTLYSQYKIYDSDDNEVNLETLQMKMLSPKIVKRCIGTTNTSPVSQCSKNALDNYDYCKIHLYKMCLVNKDSNDSNESKIHSIEYKCSNTHISNDNLSLKKVFIDDSFYYTDNIFIYDSNNTKVGYISKNEYILTSDPFILEMF
jgi:hypothetical protein